MCRDRQDMGGHTLKLGFGGVFVEQTFYFLENSDLRVLLIHFGGLGFRNISPGLGPQVLQLVFPSSDVILSPTHFQNRNFFKNR